MKYEYIVAALALIVLLCVWGLSMTAYTGCFFMFWCKTKMESFMASIDRAFRYVTHL